MIDEQRQYLSYLLRLWQDRATPPAKHDSSPAAHGRWRASLENPHTGERLGFATIRQLFAFLEEQVANEGQTEIARGMPHPSETKTANLAREAEGRSDSHEAERIE